MGGLAGHMMHPYENLDLTIGELKQMCKDSLNRRFRFKEKIDGLNITVIFSKDGIKLARNKKEQLSGGFELQEISSRFDNKNVVGVYISALTYLAQDLTKFIQLNNMVDDGVLITNLEKGAVYELNVECIGDFIPNLIDYQGNVKYVIHDVKDVKGFPSYLLNDFAEETQRKVELTNIRTTYSNNIYVDELFNNEKVCFDSQTIYEYLYDVFLDMYRLQKNDATIEAFAKIMDKNPANIRVIRELWKSRGYDVDKLNGMVENKSRVRRKLLLNLEKIILTIGSELISHVIPHMYCENPQKFITNDINYIAHNLPNDVFGKWMFCNFSIPNVEGIVFEYKGNTYKWTGAFAVLNSVFGGPKKDDIRKHAGLD